MDKLPVQNEQGIKSTRVSFLGYNVQNINFQLNPGFVPSGSVDIEFTVNVGVETNLNERKIVVMLEASVFNDATKKNYPFSVSVKLNGVFEVDRETTEDELRQIGEINGTAALFPFLRSTLAGICQQANQPAVMLPLVNVYNMIEQQKRS